MDELLREFIAETNEHLAVLERDLVAIERAPEDWRLVDDIFRNIHSIKGTCGFLGLKRLESLLHAAENVLDKLRDEASPAATGTLLGACDRAKIDRCGAGAGRARARWRRWRYPRAAGAGDAARRGSASAHPGDACSRPQPAACAGGDIDPRQSRYRRAADGRGQRAGARAKSAHADAARPGRPGSALALQRLSQVTSDLQESVMKTRMQPIGQAWAKLPRMVRDLAPRSRQEDRAETRRRRDRARSPGARSGRKTRSRIWCATRPITASRRRPSAARAGKSETGIVTLSACQEGGAIVITLADDGRGIDPAAHSCRGRAGAALAERCRAARR